MSRYLQNHSAWLAALICGTVAAVGVAIGNAIQLAGSSMPDPMPAVLIAEVSAAIALVAGIFVAVSVLCGLLLARCRQLTVRSVLILSSANVAVLGTLALVSVETHAVKLDMQSAESNPYEVP